MSHIPRFIKTRRGAIALAAVAAAVLVETGVVLAGASPLGHSHAVRATSPSALASTSARPIVGHAVSHFRTPALRTMPRAPYAWRSEHEANRNPLLPAKPRQAVDPVVQRQLAKPNMPAPAGGIPKDVQEHIRLMSDLMVIAFQTDLTRVVTFPIANDGSNRPYKMIEVSEGHHDLSHHGSDPKKLEKIKKINTFHMEQLYEAGGVPAVMKELARGGLLHLSEPTITGQTIGEQLERVPLLGVDASGGCPT